MATYNETAVAVCATSYVKRPSRKKIAPSRIRELCCWQDRSALPVERMAHSIVASCAVLSALERYGVGFDDEPPSRTPITA